MNRLRALVEKAFLFAWAVIGLLAVTCKVARGQQGPPPVMTSFRTQSTVKLDPSLGWMTEYSQPFIYELWWAEIAACEGLPLDWAKVRRVQFFQVNAPKFVPVDIEAVVLAITYDSDQVFIANPYIWNRSLVSHEMLHLLLKWAGDPTWYFHNPDRYARCGLRASGEPPPNQ
jgi:hypothetical protein